MEIIHYGAITTLHLTVPAVGDTSLTSAECSLPSVSRQSQGEASRLACGSPALTLPVLREAPYSVSQCHASHMPKVTREQVPFTVSFYPIFREVIPLGPVPPLPKVLAEDGGDQSCTLSLVR